jgi:AcrR family transcriptional regulator
MGRPRGDHDGRRAQVARAAWQVIVRDGLERATIRAIARELGSATSVVTHYFRSKDDLLRLVLDRLVKGQAARARQASAERTGIARVEAIVESALPLDATTRRGWTIWVAFLGLAVGNRDLIEEHRRRYAQFRAPLREALAACAEAGLLRPGLDLDRETNALIVLGDGIGLSAVIDAGRLPPEHQVALVRERIARLRRRRPPAPRAVRARRGAAVQP